MSWKKFLIIPYVMRLQRQAPREVSGRWDGYWAVVRETGSYGDVIWDVDSPAEAEGYLEVLRQHSDTSLPVVDVGCGNGRLTRRLATTFPSALGVDLSPHAITLAVQESQGLHDVAFRSLDMTAPAAGAQLAAELGEVNVVVRGVFHVLDRTARLALVSNIRDLLGTRGTLLLAETNFPGSSVDYLEQLGARPNRLPRPLELAITAGIPRPSRFGSAELAECFPSSSWHLLVTEATGIDIVPPWGLGPPTTLPGCLAVLRTRAGAAT